MEDKEFDIMLLCLILGLFILFPLVLGNMYLINFLEIVQGKLTAFCILLFMEIVGLLHCLTSWHEIWDNKSYFSERDIYDDLIIKKEDTVTKTKLTIEEQNKIFSNQPFNVVNTIKEEDS